NRARSRHLNRSAPPKAQRLPAWLSLRASLFRQRSVTSEMAVRLSRTFVFRKLHQLTGIVPLGFFLLEHFYTNSKAMTGRADFDNAVKDLQSIPYILFVEVG